MNIRETLRESQQLKKKFNYIYIYILIILLVDNSLGNDNEITTTGNKGNVTF